MVSSCDGCHKQARVAQGAAMVAGQDKVRAGIASVRTGLAVRKAGDPKAVKAREALDTALLDQSLGAHNPGKVSALLDGAAKALKGK
jgi:hypothetical protein